MNEKYIFKKFNGILESREIGMEENKKYGIGWRNRREVKKLKERQEREIG